METLEKSRMCRLCGKESGIAVNIFDKNENHVRKINAILPVLVHEMDLLPKQMCHRCSYKLEEFYDFYVNCAKTDTKLKSQLSWMSKENLEEKIVIPMVKMNPFKIKMEPPDDESVDPKLFGQFGESSLFFPASFLQHSFEPPSPMITCSRCRCLCNRSIKVDNKSPQPIENLSKIESKNQFPSDVANSSPKVKKCKEQPLSLNNGLDLIQDFPDKNIVESDNYYSKSKKMNRALRPRKTSVDYMGHKKKGSILNLKAKLKEGLDILNPVLVKPVNIKLPQRDLSSRPVIKLEKVDDQMTTLRKRKNLEEFNKRIKEFQSKKKKEESRSKKILESRKQFQKEVNLRRKSLQNDQNLQRFHNEAVSKDVLNRSIEIEESFSENNSLLLEVTNNAVCSLDSNDHNNLNDKIFKATDRKIKQERYGKVFKINEFSNEKLCEENFLKLDQVSSKLEEKLPLRAVVKLEKDYTCNVDYPRIKIKRQQSAAEATKSQDGAIKDLIKNDSCKERTDKKTMKKDGSKVLQKILRSSEKRLKVVDNSEKIQKECKKKKKKSESNVHVESNLNAVHDSKRHCEKCNTYFRNSELYKLHPCYQN